MSQVGFLLQFGLYGSDALLNVGAVVDVYVAEHVVLGLYTGCKVFVVVGLAVLCLAVLLVPLPDALGYLGVEIAVGVEKVESLIHIDDDVEQQLYTTSGGEGGRNHRHAEQLAKLGIVDVVASLLRLVEHIEGAHHA